MVTYDLGLNTLAESKTIKEVALVKIESFTYILYVIGEDKKILEIRLIKGVKNIDIMNNIVRIKLKKGGEFKKVDTKIYEVCKIFMTMREGPLFKICIKGE